MNNKKKYEWEERHFKMAEKSDKMFREHKQGDEIDF